MPSAAILDFDSLIAPVPGDNPGGQELSFSTRKRLDDSRLEPDPLEPSTADRRADWKGVIDLASDTLINSSKDLLVAARLVEALTKKHDFAGMRDGIKLFRLLVEHCWDYLHPMPEPGDTMEVREGPFKWLNDSTKGAKFPTAIANIPAIRVRGEAYSYFDWKTAARLPDFEAAIPACDPKKLQDASDDLDEALSELRSLGALLDSKLADASPDLTSEENPSNIGQAMKHYRDMLDIIMRRRGIGGGSGEAASEEATGDESSGEGDGGSGFSRISVGKTNREGLYRQLEQISDALQRIEPHSPIPFLLKRAVRLGALPFPELMRAIIRETAAIDELDRLLGLDAGQPPAE